MLMKGENNYMKLLKIEKELGWFSIDGVNYNTIEKISKEDIFEIIKKVLDEEVEVDNVTEQNDIKMPAQKIIYEKIYEKIVTLNESKSEIMERNNKEFADAFEKYKLES